MAATLRKRFEWLQVTAKPGIDETPPTPFYDRTAEGILGTLMGMSDINRFSHVVMEKSPVDVPFGLQAVKALALRIFGY